MDAQSGDDSPRQEPRSVATTSLASSMSLSMPAFSLHEQHLGNTAGSVNLFRATTLRASINIAASYPLIVIDDCSSGRHRAVALLALSLLETYHSSLLYARRHICSNPLELLKSHLCIHRYWTPCVCSSLRHLWRASRSHHARVCVLM